ncbi:GNAT family N-acetyltransferase [Halomonas cerina]|uniref:Putative acetyltransferase n=1 Tax=Halomonas cerina TaxID=447424 RepID=A0A839VA38_9GAMM|nr:GNAT family N-acetyltransferase [Halomonas cerina]MBB3190820.1 putative acetyltransferase [Halomonas cerina]
MIRTAVAEDLPVLVDIWRRAALHAHDFLPAAFWEARVDDMVTRRLPGCEILVLDAGGRVLGFAALDGDHLDALYVEPDVQSFGYGAQLLAHAMQGRRRITLDVYTRNVRAVSFYHRMGFTAIGEQADPDSGESETRMEWCAEPSAMA